MSAAITLFDVLGVAGAADPVAAAAALWPGHLLQASTGARDKVDRSEAPRIIGGLQDALSFRNVRPGADPQRVGLTAEVLVGAVPPPFPLVLCALPDVAWRLLPTSMEPARLMVTACNLGVELIIESLPVEIALPTGFLMPLGPPGANPPPLTETQMGPFVAGHHDTLEVVLNRTTPSLVRVHIKLRMTEDGRFVIEPAVPLSIGPCRFSGLPCRGIHDLNLFPSPRLGVAQDDEAHYGEQALEWTRHPLLGEGNHDFGVVTVRTVDLDDTRPPLSDLRAMVNPEAAAARRFEWVLEDLAFPIGTDPFPVPHHFMVGLRRELAPGDDPAGAYNLGGLAIPLKGAARLLHFKYLVVEQLFLRSVPSPELEPTTAQRQFAFLKLALVDEPTGTGTGATIDLADEWTVLAGLRFDPGILKAKLFGASISVRGVRLGASISRLLMKGKSVLDAGVLVGDIEITLAGKPPATGASEGIVKLQGESEQPRGVVVHDFGIRFGSLSVGSFWQTGGAKLTAFDSIELSVDEFGMITEPSGDVYFGFSGSIPIPGGGAKNPVSQAPNAGASCKPFNNNGFRFYRLRYRGGIGRADEAPLVLLDGLGLSLRFGTLGITGFGMASEYVLDAHRYKEAGLSVSVVFPAAGVNFSLGGLFLHGSVRGPVQNFSYWMVGLQVGLVPLAGSLKLTDVRLLFAWNMTPNLSGQDVGSATAMRLFEWYKANRNAVALPTNRNLSSLGWKPEAESYTFAAAAKVQVGSRAITVDGFFVYRKTASGNGLLAGLEIFVGGSKKAVGFAVLEIDGDRWSVSAGLSVGTENVIGKRLPLLSDVPLLTGTFYHTNRPATTAIGQFADPATWLAVHLGGGTGKKYGLWIIEIFAGVCLQTVDLPEGPHVFALRVSVTGGSRLFKVGGIDFYLSVELTAGVWRTESKSSGFTLIFEGAINIDVFYVFSWGASARLQLDHLGCSPSYCRWNTEVQIHTPWWLPDVSFRWHSTDGVAAPETLKVLATPVVQAATYALNTQEAVPLPALSPVVGSSIDAQAVYSFAELDGAAGSIPQILLDQVGPGAVDSALALHFNVSVNDKLVFGSNTVAGVGNDRSNDVSTVYDLVELGIRRRPAGSNAAWTVLIDAAASRQESLAGLTPAQVQQRMRQPVRLRWDADFHRAGQPDTRRLLINTDTPFLMAVVNLAGDEALVQNRPGWPCCGPRPKPVWHQIHFNDVAPGARVPATQRFTDSEATLRWTGLRPPPAGPGVVAVGTPSVARLAVDAQPSGVVARLAFPDPAQLIDLFVTWSPLHLNRVLVLRSFRGLKLLETLRFSFTQAAPARISLNVAPAGTGGITEVTIALEGAPVNAPAPDFGWVEWTMLRFRSVAEVQGEALEEGRCQATAQGAARPGGRFAWLPHHEYELTLKTRVTVAHTGSGVLVREVPQTLRFSTKGLPGLNRTERVGSEFEPYVESVYPGPGRPLYRSEPVALALSDKANAFRPPELPQPYDPPERRQQMDWLMTVARIGGAGIPERLSQPDIDWIVAHRGIVPPPRPTRRPVDVSSVSALGLRQARSLDPLWQRFEAVLASPASCQQTPTPLPSRVLLHRPCDPAVPAAAPALWPARSQLRASVQLRGSAFINRMPFVAGDETALLDSAGAWQVLDGVLSPAAPSSSQTRLGLFGEAAWRTAQIEALVDPHGGAAGVAVAVTGSTALLFLIDEPTRTLKALRRQGAVDTEVASTALPADWTAPSRLSLQAYEDGWQASAGTAQLKLARGPAESGRWAVAARAGGRIGGLRVDALEIYRFEVLTSQYADLGEHLGSWSGQITTLPAAAPPTASLLELMLGTPLNELMAPGADPARRQQAFDRWTAALGVPMCLEVDRLSISRRDVSFLLLESPEPLPFSEDLRLQIKRISGGTGPVRYALLSNGAETRSVLVPLTGNGVPTSWMPGDHHLTWTMDRARYRAASADIDSRYQQVETMRLRL